MTATRDTLAVGGVTSLPATGAQQDIWAAAQLGDDAALALVDARLLHLHGAPDVDRLRSAITALVDRHPALRATVSDEEGGADGGSAVAMRISPRENAHVVWVDLRDRPMHQRDEALAALCRDAVRQEFDVRSGPLVRFTVVAFAADTHALLIVAHQIVCDRASFDVLVEDLSELYNAPDFAAGRALSTAAADAAADVSALVAADAEVTSSTDARHEHDETDYWRTQFATVPRDVDLPLDRPRPAYPTYRSARADVALSAQTTRDVHALAAYADVSTHAVLLGGFATLLSRLSGHDELIIGTMVSARRGDETARDIGQHTVLLPIRCVIPPTDPFARILRDTQSTLTAAHAHAPTRAGGVARMVQGLGRARLVSVVLNVAADDARRVEFDGFHVRVDQVARAGELFDLVVDARFVDGLWHLACQYSETMLDATTVSRWMLNFEQLLRAGAASPTEAGSRLAILSPIDIQAIAACNDTSRALPSHTLVHELVEAEAERAPNRVAVEQGNVLLRYDELNARANQLAHHLRELGVRRGELVGLLLERTPDTIVALLAVLKAGAGYVPLDPTMPAERLERMANDASLAALITVEPIRDTLNITAREIVSLDGDAGVIALSPTNNPARDAHTAQPEDPAYVIFTSGSTGRPKGVLVPHIGLLNLALSLRHTPGMQRDDVVLATTTLVFDVAVSEVLLPLTTGARIVLASRETAADGTQLRRVVETRGVTWLCGAPASFHLLLEAGWTGAPHLTIICTGEAMPRELAISLVRCGRDVWNAYGPSETTVWSTFHRIEVPVGRILIGKPIDNTVIAIRDAQGQQVPVGVVGEMFIGGVGVATGYLNLDSLSTERFRDDLERSDLRWYRTGDLVRLLPSGEIECLGRADDQVKVRGYRIEPGEIAAVVSTWPGVRQAVVVAREDRANDVRLVTYVIADADTQFGDEFRAHLKRVLPQYMVPAAVVPLDAFPLTASGKVDRKRLPAPPATVTNSATAFVAPRTDTERLLVELWEEALGGRVGVRDDFFALGGHSLLASQILSRLRRVHGVDLTFRRIFEAPTVEQLAKVVDAVAAHSNGATPIVARTQSQSAPLTAQQERICLLEELEPRRRRAHSHPAAWLLRGPLDVVALEQALRALVDRHAILRTSFHWQDGARVQRVNEHVSVALHRVDLSGEPVWGQAQALAECFAATHAVPFDIAVAPLFRATLVTLGPETHQLYTLQHGLIWDGWSFDLFVRDLGELYASAVEQRAPQLPPLPVTFGDFASWQQQWLGSPEASDQQLWWNTQLAGARHPVSLPTDRPRPAASSFAGAYVSTALPPDDIEALQQLARRLDSTLYMVCFAAYATLLYRYSAQRDLLVASPMRARTQAELENVLGPFVNAVVMRTKISVGMTFTELVRHVREVALDTHAHQELPFEALGAQLPAIRAVFSLQDARERPRTFGALRADLSSVPLQFAANDLTLWMQHYPDRLAAVLNFSADLFDTQSAQLMLDQFRALLAAVVRSPDVILDALSLTTPGTESTVVEQPITGGTHDEPAASLLAMIDGHARAHGSSLAVRSGGDRVTYAMLSERSTRLASALSQRGIVSGDLVAVAMDGSAEWVSVSLGVLRAGARLVVLSPDDSAEYRSLVLRTVAPVRCIGEFGDASGADVATVALADLLREGVGAPAPAVEARAGGLLLVSRASADAALQTSTISMSRLEQQATAMSQSLAIATDVRVMCAMPTGASGRVAAVLSVLSRGGALVLTEDASIYDTAELAEAVRDGDCDCMIGTADAWRATLDAGWGPRLAHGLLVGGGLSLPQLDRIVDRGCALWVAIGGSHDGALSARYDVPSTGATGAIGAPIATEFRTVDDNGAIAPTGLAGWLESRAHAGDDVQAWTRTPLRGRRTARGGVQLSADERNDAWFGGDLVALHTVERLLVSDDDVHDVSVGIFVDRRDRPWLVAHLALQPGADVADVRARLRARVPSTWLPRRFVHVGAIVRTDDGVVDRERLPAPFATDAAAAARNAPRTPDERLLATLWTDVLGGLRVGRDDNFFALGGTSLSCFRVIELLRRETQVRVSPRVLLTGTLAQAAEHLGVARASATSMTLSTVAE